MHVMTNDPATDPVDELRHCEKSLRDCGFWKRCDLAETWPLTTEQAVQMLVEAAEFAVARLDVLDLIDRKLLPRPATGDDGSLEWFASDLVAAVGTLNAREQWRATPSHNDAFKHPLQLVLERAREAGEVAAIVEGVPGGPRYDLRHLLCLLVASDVREGRIKIATLLKAVLEVDYGVTV